MLFAPFTQNRLKASCTKRLQDRTERIVTLRRYSSEMDERNASMKMSALLTISFGHYRVPSGKPAILVEKIAIAEQGSLLMSAGGTRFNPPFAYHSTMIITSGSLAGQGAAITLTKRIPSAAGLGAGLLSQPATRRVRAVRAARLTLR